MASPHVPADMMQPAGMLTLGLFPNYADQAALDVFLGGLLDAGYAKADDAEITEQDEKDGAAIAWAYHMAYMAVYQRLLSTPSSASIDGEASRQYLWSQIDAFKKLADDYLAQYSSFILDSDTSVSSHEVATSVPNKYVW
jgi:hypothetical protein